MNLRSLLLVLIVAAASAPQARSEPPGLFDKSNLVAWCIVPFDAKKRSPEDRAEMLQRLGIRKYAYDWRAEHVPSFEAELAALKKRDIELTALWLPTPLGKDGRTLLDAVRRHGLKPQLWTMYSPEPGDGARMIQQSCTALAPLAREAAEMGASVALYNHGGWFGEPENQIAIINQLRQQGIQNVGIVYNMHHGHDHLARIEKLLVQMKPHLLCLNLNGMTAGGDKAGRKILPLGQGDLDASLLKTIAASGYKGPIGLLNHTDEDAEGRLLDNLDGLAWLQDPSKPRPTPRTWRAR